MTKFDEDDHVVWSQMVDQDAWEVLVRVGKGYTFNGTLELWNHSSGTLIHSETVPLSVDSYLGKESPDWESWQRIALLVIDNLKERKPMEDEYADEVPC